MIPSSTVLMPSQSYLTPSSVIYTILISLILNESTLISVKITANNNTFNQNKNASKIVTVQSIKKIYIIRYNDQLIANYLFGDVLEDELPEGGFEDFADLCGLWISSIVV